MITFPNGKVNIGLNIVSKRKDGYHDIETVFYPIPLCDVLEIVPAKSGKSSFTQTGLTIDGDSEDNLVMKAFRLLGEDKAPADIYLRKSIPFGAGLGGGSSDAAFMLKLMNDYYSLNLSDEELERLASQIGADCPFFIKNRPVFAEGIGNVFSPVDLSLKGLYLTLIHPGIHVSTAEAYSNVIPRKPETSIKDIIRQPVASWRDVLRNDFEENIFRLYPEIKTIKDHLYDCGALYASMSGSGSSVFGLFDAKPTLTENRFDRYSVFQLPLF